MALVLKTNKTFTDRSGNEYANAYAVIDINNGDKLRKVQDFSVQIYKDRDARDSRFLPVYQKNYSVVSDEFDTYFSPTAIANDTDQYHQAYVYALASGDWDDWESDEL